MRYRLVRGVTSAEDGSSCLTYGVECEAMRVEDVTTDVHLLCELIKRFNELMLEPEHLMCALEDFLALRQGEREED